MSTNIKLRLILFNFEKIYSTIFFYYNFLLLDNSIMEVDPPIIINTRSRNNGLVVLKRKRKLN